MADTGTGRTWATTGGSAVWGGGRSPLGSGRRLDQKGTLSAGRTTEKKVEPEQNDCPLTLIGVIEKWVCLVLGIVCVVSGILGISMSLDQNALPEDLAWTGSVYVPMLRISASACLALGVVLVCLGWASPRRTRRTVPARK